MHGKIQKYRINNKNDQTKNKMTSVKKLIHTVTSTRRNVALFALTGLFIFSAAFVPYVQADRFQEQIDALNAQNAQNQAVQGQLGAEAVGITDTINKLQGEINAVQGRINENEGKMADLKGQIAAAEAELVKQRDLLGQTIRAMYLEGEISTVEMLATSKDLSDFFDKQQYRESVNSKIKTTLDTITQLKLDLNSQKETVEKLLAEQKGLQGQLATQRAESNRLLSLNQSQQSELDGQIKQNSAKAAELRKQQAAENARLFGNNKVIGGAACDSGSGDTYPAKWCAIPQDSVIDSWGMYNRECVSYTAWKVYESGRRMPYWGGHGNANQWDENARAEGIPVDGTPRAGDIAVSNRGYYGHVMFVESVNGNGTINISQYNAGLNGTYSRVYNMSTSGLVFIHF